MSGRTRKKTLSFLVAFSMMCTSVFSLSAPDAQAAKKATLKTKTLKVKVGKKKTIKLKNAVKKKYKYTFKTKNKKIATVTKKGVVKGKKAGKTTIVVKETKKNSKKARTVGKVKVTVTKAQGSNNTATNETAAPASAQPSGAAASTQPGGAGTPTPAPQQSTAPGPQESTAPGPQESVTPGPQESTEPGPQESTTPGPQQSVAPPPQISKIPSTPEPEPTPIPEDPSTPNPNAASMTTAVKVYMDSISEENLVAEIAGPGMDPTPTPEPTPEAEPTPEPTPQVIYDVDFEDGNAGVFKGRGAATVSVIDGGAEDSAKCLKVTGRTSSWNGAIIDISSVVAVGNKYDVSFWARQDTGKKMTFKTTLQYNLGDGDKYPNQNTTELESGKWTKITATTEAIPEYKGSIFLYWESGDTDDFCIDNFKMQGVVKTGEESDMPDLSAGLPKENPGNPSITSRLTADPWAMEYNGRIYVYGTNDSQQYELAPDKDNNYAKINTLNCYSSADLVNWTDHGVIQVGGTNGAAKWAGNSWAPAAAHKKINGKEKFFLYFANSANNLGVLTADSPTGPWTDPTVSEENPKGKPLIDRSTPGCSVEEIGWLFDPAVLVDDDGQAYLYFGGIGDMKDRVNPKCARVIKLGEDMVSTVGEAKVIDAPYMFEDSGINKIGDKYYYSYCTNWDSIEGREEICPTANIAVMVSDNPMEGFEYVGCVLKNPGSYFGAYGNNHHCFTAFKGEYYAFYHTKSDSTSLGTKADYRTTYVDKLNLGENGDFTDADGSVANTKMTRDGVAPVRKFNPYDRIQAETFSMAMGVGTAANELETLNPRWNTNQSLWNKEIGSYVGVSNVDFGTKGAGILSMKMAEAGKETANYEDYTVNLDKKITGEHTLYFVFEKKNILVDSWRFWEA